MQNIKACYLNSIPLIIYVNPLPTAHFGPFFILDASVLSYRERESMQLLPLPKNSKSCTLKLVPNSQTHTKKVNNDTEVNDLEGAYWELEI